MMKLEGIHHITAITADAPGNVEFYVGVLGLRMVKKSVNQDDRTVYHLFYGDEQGSPGADLTFFEYPGTPRGEAGAGMVHGICWRVACEQALGTTSGSPRAWRVTSGGARWWRSQAPVRHPSSTASTSARSTSVSRAACCLRSRPSVPASRSMRPPSTSASGSRCRRATS